MTGYSTIVSPLIAVMVFAPAPVPSWNMCWAVVAGVPLRRSPVVARTMVAVPPPSLNDEFADNVLSSETLDES
uniref:Secreted protein n=1 Tax=Anopheles darlingi TaxID=43151 RepID=A0A2M4D732_ANODA